MPSDLPSQTWTVEMLSPVKPEIQWAEVDAAYCQEERSYTLFKDAGHAVVAAYRTEFVVRVLRGSVDDTV